MATFSGKDGSVILNNVTIGEVRDFSIEQTANRVDSTVMGDDWMKGVITQKSWSGSINIYYDPAQSDTWQSVLDNGDAVTVNLFPQGNTTSLKYYTGNCHVTSLNVSESFDGMIESSISVEGQGELSIATV